MEFQPTPLDGAYVIVPERKTDERGFFVRTWCRQEFSSRGLCTDWVQSSISFNRRAGTLRGLHFQKAPFEETKLVQCIAGAIFDVIVDLRPSSSTYLRWFSIELSRANGLMLYIPQGYAHGFQTLEDDTEVSYQITPSYQPASAVGLRWDDPALGIVWPKIARRIISPKDLGYPDIGKDGTICDLKVA